jgi:membrane fusion protein
VTGITVPSAGLIKLMAPQAGVVVERRVKEGQQVKAGEVLYVLSAERMTGDGDGAVGAQSAVLDQLRKRRTSLIEESDRQRLLLVQQTAALERRLADLRAESAQLMREAQTQRQRVASVQAQVGRFEDLARRQFMSELGVAQKREELLEQTARLQALERNRIALTRETASVAAELAQLPLRSEQQRAEVDRAAAAVEQDVASTEANRQIVVTAPQDGTVTAILADPGQMAGNQPLLTLLPAGSQLEAHLYAPSKAVGFVEPGQKVRVRFAAYPYQKFGQYEGTVAQVSRSSLAAGELPPQLVALGQQAGSEGMYRVSVALASQDVVAYARPQPLTAGMQLEADVLQETRTLIEWVLEPIVGLRGKV